MIGANIRQRRILGGLTQAALAGFIGVSLLQLQRYEDGADGISARKLCMIARLFGLPMDAFFVELDT